MDHKEMLEYNAQYIQSFVVKYIGKPKRLGEMLFKKELEYIRKQYDEVDCDTPPDNQLALRALSRASYKVGMYSVDHVNVLPHGTCVKVMLGLFLSAADIVITQNRGKFFSSMRRSMDNMN